MARTIGAGIVAGLLIGVVVDESEAGIGLPWQGLVPGVGAPAGPRESGQSLPGNDPKPQEGGSGKDDRGTGNSDTDTPPEEDRTGKDDTDDRDRETPPDEDRTGKDDADNSDTDTSDTDTPSDEDLTTTDETDTDTPPEEDRTGPSVGLAQISTAAVGQQVVDQHGSLMQTCGPPGTPATYSVWVAVSDPSGVAYVSLTIEHPSDGTYFSTDGIPDGSSVRFDVPAYRTGPKYLETVQLQLSARAKDMRGNRTEASLGALTLHECGEPG
ncbi:hypothetical protein AB0M39_31230 [Streptomyces sp. NPDC051907]|uniref:hypothetical protein n=1 Tax=Streptomyces sp. NPDC051907 TaxID=3155284 RepID=UPI0034264C18